MSNKEMKHELLFQLEKLKRLVEHDAEDSDVLHQALLVRNVSNDVKSFLKKHTNMVYVMKLIDFPYGPLGSSSLPQFISPHMLGAMTKDEKLRACDAMMELAQRVKQKLSLIQEQLKEKETALKTQEMQFKKEREKLAHEEQALHHSDHLL